MVESKKVRLVLDLRHVNSFIKQNKFWYENLTTLLEILSEGDYFTNFDLSSGYHHIEINFLVLNGALKMGLQNIFNFVFYHLVCHQHVTFLQSFCAHLLKLWRGIGIKAIIYIEGGIAASRTAAELVKNDLVSVESVINVEKSDCNSKSNRKWLDTITCTIEMAVIAPSKKLISF